MPKVTVNHLTMNYEQQGAGDPLILIPYLAADNACYAFQVADYAKHFKCFSLDLRGALMVERFVAISLFSPILYCTTLTRCGTLPTMPRMAGVSSRSIT